MRFALALPTTILALMLRACAGCGAYCQDNFPRKQWAAECCDCEAVANDPPDYGCYGKGGINGTRVAAEYYCGQCGGQTKCSSPRDDNDPTTGKTRFECDQLPCAWANSTCGPCKCQCNGCLMPNGDCRSRTLTTEAECSAPTDGHGHGALPGTWCECSPMSCSIARKDSTCAAAVSTRPTISGGCQWVPNQPNYLELPEGICAECFTDDHCVSGVCHIVPRGVLPYTSSTSTCQPCDRKHQCSGRGNATHRGPGRCECASCDAGFTGEQCELVDCSAAKLGEPCSSCQAFPMHRCVGAEGVDDVCFEKAADGATAATCGSRPLECLEGKDILSCNGGVVRGTAKGYCFCDCPTGQFGPYCEIRGGSPPPSQACAASASASASAFASASADDTNPNANSDVFFTLRVRNDNDRNVDVRLCSADHCNGNERGQAGQYQSCSAQHNVSSTTGPITTGLLAPRQEVDLHIPTSVKYLIFVDRTCGDKDAELYAPAGPGGFVAGSLVNFTVPPICPAPLGSSPFKHGLTCATFSGCDSPSNNTFAECKCAHSIARYPDGHPECPCDAATCCAWRVTVVQTNLA